MPIIALIWGRNTTFQTKGSVVLKRKFDSSVYFLLERQWKEVAKCIFRFFWNIHGKISWNWTISLLEIYYVRKIHIKLDSTMEILPKVIEHPPNFLFQSTPEQLFPTPATQWSSAKKRSSRSQMLFRIGVLQNFAIFTGKQLCWSLFLIKLQVFLQNTLVGCFCCFKKLVNFPGKHQWWRLHRFIFLTNTTE